MTQNLSGHIYPDTMTSQALSSRIGAMYGEKSIAAEDAAALARPNFRIYIAGCLGEPAALLEAVSSAPALWLDMTLTGAFVPGVNRRNLTLLGEGTKVETIFATEGLKADDPRVSILPLHYSSYDSWLSMPGHVDIAYFQVPPPRADGTVGLGPSVDFTPAVIRAGARLVGEINPQFPDVANGPRIPVERFEAFISAERHLDSYDPVSIDSATETIAALIASEIDDRDTLQLGLGKVQAAVLPKLAHHRALGFHAGMISAPILPLIAGGVFSKGVTTGVAFGPPGFLAEIAAMPSVCFAPVSHTHAYATLSRIERLITINSVIEIDLFGQANADSVGGRQVSGHGGMVDFIRGARAASGGRSILALPATAKGGTVSRIVPNLAPGTPVSVWRADIDMVITEFGVAKLRHAGIEERAQRLISIAAPAFRDDLAEVWSGLR